MEALGVAEEGGVGVAEDVHPGLEEADELDVPEVHRTRARRGLGQAVHVGAQVPDTLGVLALGGRQPELLGVVAEGGVGGDQVLVERVARHLREVVLEDARALADRLDDAELAVRVVVGEDLTPPQEEVVRPPARAAAELVLDHVGERGREDLAADERAIVGEPRPEVELEAIVCALGEVQDERRRQQPDEDEDRQDSLEHPQGSSRYAASNSPAAPIPPPTHMVTMPQRFFWRFSSSISVPVSRAPVIP